MGILHDLALLIQPTPVPRTMESLLYALLRFALAQFQASAGCFALRSGDILVYPALLNAQDEKIPAPDPETGQFIMEQVILPGQPVLPHLRERAGQSVAAACVPLASLDQVMGALYLEFPPENLAQAAEHQETLIFLGRYAAILATCEDRSLRAESEFQAAQRAEAEIRTWKTLVMAWPGSVLITDLDGRVIFCNPAFSQASGYSAEEIWRQPLSILRSDRTPEETFAEMWSTIRSGHTWTGEFCNRRKDGSQYWVSAIVGPILDGQGNISQFFSLQREIDQEKTLARELERLTITDPLTGVLNRGHLFIIGEQALREAIRYDHPLTLMVVDINHMRELNERFGHQAGDQVLKAIADLLNGSLREVDVLGRLSGEEFAVLMPHTPLQDALQVADRLRAQAANLAVYTASGTVRFTICAGLAAAAPGMTFSQMLEKAEQSLKVAKRALT